MNTEHMDQLTISPEMAAAEREAAGPVASRAREALLALRDGDPKLVGELYSLVGTMKSLLVEKGVNPVRAAAFHELVGSGGYKEFVTSDDIADSELNVANFMDHWNEGDAGEWLSGIAAKRAAASNVSENRAA